MDRDPADVAAVAKAVRVFLDAAGQREATFEMDINEDMFKVLREQGVLAPHEPELSLVYITPNRNAVDLCVFEDPDDYLRISQHGDVLEVHYESTTR